MRMAGGAKGYSGGNIWSGIRLSIWQKLVIMIEYTKVPQYWPPSYGVAGGPVMI